MTAAPLAIIAQTLLSSLFRMLFGCDFPKVDEILAEENRTVLPCLSGLFRFLFPDGYSSHRIRVAYN